MELTLSIKFPWEVILAGHRSGLAAVHNVGRTAWYFNSIRHGVCFRTIRYGHRHRLQNFHLSASLSNGCDDRRSCGAWNLRCYSRLVIQAADVLAFQMAE